MKKILMIILLLTMYTTMIPKVDASSTLKKLVVIANNNPSLDLKGYKLIETNINFEKEGTYYALYLDEITKQKKERPIEVISKYTLTTGIINFKLLEELFYEGYEIIKTTKINSGYASIAKGFNEYVFILDNNTKPIFYPLGKEETIEVFDICYDEQNNYIYCLGNFFANRIIDICLFGFNEEGICMFRKTYGGTYQDEALNFCLSNKDVIICGKTRSNNGTFPHTLKKEDSFLLYIDKLNGDVKKYLDLSVEGIDYIDQVLYNDYTYAVMHYYYANVPITKIIKINDDYQEVDNTYINSYRLIISKAFKSLDNNMYFLYDSFDDESSSIKSYLCKFDQALNTTLIDSFENDTSETKDVAINEDEVKILYYDTSTYETFVRSITTETKKTISIDKNKVRKVYFAANNDIHFINDTKNRVYQNEYVIMKNLDQSIPDLYWNNYHILEDSTYSQTYINDDLFGTYNLFLYYDLPNYTLVYKKTHFVENKINIANHNQYQTGLILTFNADAYLNNLHIENGYQITKPGVYDLTLIGNNNLIEKYNFEVVDITNSKDSLKNILYNINIEKNNNYSYLEIEQHLTINNMKLYDYDKKLWLIIIPFLSLTLITISYLIIERKTR